MAARHFPAAGLELLGQRFEVERDLARASGAEAIVADPAVPIDEEVMEATGPALRVVSNFAAGYDNVDLETARERGIRVTNTPDVLTSATAELAVALMLAAGRRIAELDAYVRDGRWLRGRHEVLLGRELSGATVGLVGLGRIGLRVAELLRGFEVRLLFASRREPPDPPPGAERRPLTGLLEAADFVSVHLPLTPETRHLFGPSEFARMKPGSVFVNTSRGAVVDTRALIDGLGSGRPGAAGLDVFEDEPDVPIELRELPNTVLLPHVGSATQTTRDAMARLCVDNVIAVLEGREPPAAVV